jgi:hypothetical protein
MLYGRFIYSQLKPVVAAAIDHRRNNSRQQRIVLLGLVYLVLVLQLRNIIDFLIHRVSAVAVFD